MPVTKFTVDASGDNIDAMAAAATKEADEFFKDLPGHYRAKDVSVSYDAGYYQARLSSALKEAEERAAAWKAEHGEEEDFEDLEVVPAYVPRYSGWFEFEYDSNQIPPKKTIGDVWAENTEEAPRSYNAANDPRYQAPFE